MKSKKQNNRKEEDSRLKDSANFTENNYKEEIKKILREGFEKNKLPKKDQKMRNQQGRERLGMKTRGERRKNKKKK